MLNMLEKLKEAPASQSRVEKYFNFLARANIVFLGISFILVSFVILFALNPLSRGEFFDPLVIMSVSYILAFIFGLLALRNKYFLVIVAMMYALFFVGNYLDIKSTAESGRVFCDTIRADPQCSWSDRDDGFVCVGGAHAGIIPSNMCSRGDLTNPTSASEKNIETFYQSIPCGGDWALRWDDIHGLWGGMKVSVCGKDTIIDVVSRSGEKKTYRGLLVEDEEIALHRLAEEVIKIKQPRIPSELPPDASLVRLSIELGGDGYGYQFLFNEMPKEAKDLYDEMNRVVQPFIEADIYPE